MNCGERGHASMTEMKFDQRAQINVCKSIAIGHTESLVIAEIVLNPFHSTTSVGIKSGVGKGDTPGFAVTLVSLQLIIAGRVHFQREIAVEPLMFEKISLDRISQVAQAEDEIFQSILRIDFHQVPKHGPSTDFN